ncbi:uncharacterized protein JCM6883_000747 [Sporobolomyces salmoneus]|uniref:uncharacterized protein n=1 Tax=Sporobolomyces salmoneus TaxID=183962 RepID=UPI00317C84EE
MNRFDLLPSVTLKTLSAQLYPDETLILHQDGVGLYDGKEKSPLHYEGRLHLTSHRLIFVSSPSSSPSNYSSPSPSPSARSIPVGLQLSLVRQTEYWTGFLKSSPKITLLLHSESNESTSSLSVPTQSAPSGTSTPAVSTSSSTGGDRSWICRVCGMRNVPTLELGLKCSLCGIKHDPTTASSSSSPSSTSTTSISPYPTLKSTPSPVPSPPPSVALDPVETGSRITCPVCTFLNHHSMSRCEMCDTPLPSSPPTIRSSTPTPTSMINVSSSSSSRPSTPSGGGGGGGGDYVRLSFRKGGIQAFYSSLKEVLSRKAWDLNQLSQVERIKLEVLKRKQQQQQQQLGKNGVVNDDSSRQGLHESSSGVGIDAILRGIDLDSQTRTDSLEDALKDLESLMRKAKEMIQLAQSINAQISSSTSSNDNDKSASDAKASNLASTSLSSLGILSSVAVTADQSRSEKEYHHSLARELGSLLQSRATTTHGRGGGEKREGLLEKRGGVIGLDELWCVWNRARGVALVSPKALKLSVPYLPLYTSNPTLHPLTFPKSGLTILHTPRYSPLAFKDRLLDLIDQETSLISIPEVEGEADAEEQRGEGGVGLLQVAKREGLSLGLTKEMIELIEFEGERAVERRGFGDGIVRDAGPGGGASGDGSQGNALCTQRIVAALEPAPYTSETVILQTRVILDSLDGMTRASKRDLITNGPTQHLRRVLIGASSQFFQQVGGCNAAIYFSTPIFEEYLGLERKLALILGAVLATVYALSACISFPLVDSVGRRKLFFIGTWGQAISTARSIQTACGAKQYRHSDRLRVDDRNPTQFRRTTRAGRRCNPSNNPVITLT